MADGTSRDDIPAGPKACRAEELAERARAWNQTIYGPVEFDEDVGRSESPMSIDDSNEGDNWRNIEEEDCSPWQTGLTASERFQDHI